MKLRSVNSEDTAAVVLLDSNYDETYLEYLVFV